MANFSSVNSLGCFPSPSAARQSANQQIKPTFVYNQAPCSPGLQSSGTLGTSGIQFPSPIYVSTSNLTNTSIISSSTPRMNVTPFIYNKSDIWDNSDPSGGTRICQNSTKSHNWKHNVPTTMPWSQNTIHFTSVTSPTKSSLLDRISPLNSVQARRLKRRANNSYLERPDSKVFINEDRVAEGMSNLQLGAIGNNNISTTADRNQAWFSTRPVEMSSTVSANDDTGEMEEEEEEEGPICTSSPSIKLCKELEAGISRKDLVQQLIMEDLAKASMQVVLWTPPGDQIKQILSTCVHEAGGQQSMSQAAQKLSRTLDVIDMGQPAPSASPSKLRNPLKEPGLSQPGFKYSRLNFIGGHPNSQSSVDMDISLAAASSNQMEVNPSRVKTNAPINVPSSNSMNFSQPSAAPESTVNDPSLMRTSLFSNNNNVQSAQSVQRNFDLPPENGRNQFIAANTRLSSDLTQSTLTRHSFDLMDDEDFDL